MIKRAAKEANRVQVTVSQENYLTCWLVDPNCLLHVCTRGRPLKKWHCYFSRLMAVFSEGGMVDVFHAFVMGYSLGFRPTFPELIAPH